jgi:hypothetical protein
VNQPGIQRRGLFGHDLACLTVHGRPVRLGLSFIDSGVGRSIDDDIGLDLADRRAQASDQTDHHSNHRRVTIKGINSPSGARSAAAPSRPGRFCPAGGFSCLIRTISVVLVNPLLVATALHVSDPFSVAKIPLDSLANAGFNVSSGVQPSSRWILLASIA